MPFNSLPLSLTTHCSVRPSVTLAHLFVTRSPLQSCHVSPSRRLPTPSHIYISPLSQRSSVGWRKPPLPLNGCLLAGWYLAPSSWQNMNMAQKEHLRVRGWVAVLLLHHRASLLLSAFDMTSTCVDKGPLSLGTQVPRAFIYLDAIVHCPA